MSLWHHLCSLNFKWPFLRCRICVNVFLVCDTFIFQDVVMGYPYYKCIDINKHECEIFNNCVFKPFISGSEEIPAFCCNEKYNHPFLLCSCRCKSQCVEYSVFHLCNCFTRSAMKRSLVYLIDGHTLNSTSQNYSLKVSASKSSWDKG